MPGSVVCSGGAFAGLRRRRAGVARSARAKTAAGQKLAGAGETRVHYLSVIRSIPTAKTRARSVHDLGGSERLGNAQPARGGGGGDGGANGGPTQRGRRRLCVDRQTWRLAGLRQIEDGRGAASSARFRRTYFEYAPLLLA